MTQYYTKLVCTAFLLWIFFYVYCYKFSKYISYKLSIEEQRSIADAWGLDLQNDIDTDQNYKCNTFDFAPIFYELKSKI